jgi:hypothetical protein
VLAGGPGVLVAHLSDIPMAGIGVTLFIGIVLVAEQARVATFARDAVALMSGEPARRALAEKRIKGVVASTRVAARTPSGWADAYRWTAMAARAYVDAGDLASAEELLADFPPEKINTNSRVGRAELLATLRAFRGDAKASRETLVGVPESAPWVRRMIEIACRVADEDGKGALKLLDEADRSGVPAGQRRTFALLRVSALSVSGKAAAARSALADARKTYGDAALVRMVRLQLPGASMAAEMLGEQRAAPG